MEESIREEIVSLHKFFESWYSATIDNTSEVFKRVESVLHEDFQIIVPSGSKLSKNQLLDVLKGQYGRFKDTENFAITIDNVDIRFRGKDIAIVTYNEIGNSEEGEKRSIITTALRKNSKLLNGLEWLHIHET